MSDESILGKKEDQDNLFLELPETSRVYAQFVLLSLDSYDASIRQHRTAIKNLLKLKLDEKIFKENYPSETFGTHTLLSLIIAIRNADASDEDKRELERQITFFKSIGVLTS